MNLRNQAATTSLILGCALTLLSANPRSALADASASVFSRTNFTQSSSNSDSALVGAATAGVSGAQTDGAFSHSFNANVIANGNNGRISAATSDTTIGAGDLASSLAEGIVFDTLTFSGTGSANVQLSFSMFGSFDNVGGSGSVSATIELTVINLKDLTVSASWTDNGPNSLVNYATSIPSAPDAIVIPSNRSPSDVQASIFESFSINPGDIWAIRGRLRVTGNAGTDSITQGRFDHTAQLALALPQGWSFTSSSGTFLTATSVPEPSCGLLLAMGCVALARRRRCRPQWSTSNP